MAIVPATAAAVTEARLIIASGGDVSLPPIPVADEDSIHLLTAVRFPPPALFFADPDRKWTLNDFEKPDRATAYSVTDEDAAVDERPQDEWQPAAFWNPKDPPTTVAPGPESEEPATTIAAAVVADEPDNAQTAGDVKTTTDDGKTATGDGNAATGDGKTATGDGRVVTTEAAVTAVESPPGGSRVGVSPAVPRPAKHRRKRPSSASGRPSEKILLTSRPLPSPVSNVRFADADYAAVIKRTPVGYVRQFR